MANTLLEKIKEAADASFAINQKTTEETFGAKTSATVADDSKKLILQAIKKEIQTDPENRGYTGKTPSQIASLLLAEYKVKTGTQSYTLADRNGSPILKNGQPQVEVTDIFDTRTPRIAVILQGIPFAPNLVVLADIQEALL